MAREFVLAARDRHDRARSRGDRVVDRLLERRGRVEPARQDDGAARAPAASGEPIVVGSTLSLSGAFAATGAIHNGIIAGKLKGPMPVQTPSGWRIDHESTPRPT